MPNEKPYLRPWIVRDSEKLNKNSHEIREYNQTIGDLRMQIEELKVAWEVLTRIAAKQGCTVDSLIAKHMK